MKSGSKCVVLLVLLDLSNAGYVQLQNFESVEEHSLRKKRATAQDLDDMDYELDDDVQVFTTMSLDNVTIDSENFVRLPNKTGQFEAVPRVQVLEIRQNADSFGAANYTKFWFYNRSNTNRSLVTTLDLNRSSLELAGYRSTLPTKILIHGWLGSLGSLVLDPLANEFLQQGDFNVFCVDWEQGANDGGIFGYPDVRYRAPEVARMVAGLIDTLLELGQAPQQIGLIGHSLGAHIAGLAGKMTKRKVASIIGLDPARPLFRVEKPEERLAADDAEYVEVIHTNGNALGFYRNIGKADFYPNGGTSQPGCGWWDLTCSHERAVHLFMESLRVRDFADRCGSVDSLFTDCSLGRAMLGGFEERKLRSKPRGVYFIQTAAEKPFLKSVSMVAAPMMRHYH